jgi:DNA-binding transcriptional LysR family regulator
MDLRALRYFIEVVRQNGFTRAAETLHVTQPTISKMVKALEDEFGGRLLLREGRGVQLTDAGQVVYDRGLEILEQAQLLRRQVAEVDHITRGELSLGIMPTTGHYMAPVIALFQQRYPGVNLQVNEQGARAQYQLIQEGKLDMALGLFAPPIRRWSATPWRARRRAWCCPPSR